MTVANHEYSYINTGSGNHIPDCLWQSASVTARVNTEQVPAIGYKGIAAISSLVGSVDLSLNGYVTSAAGQGYNLETFEAVLASPIIIETFDPDATEDRVVGVDIFASGGPRATVSGCYISSINYNFRAQQAIETTWNFVCDDVTWETITGLTSGPIDGDGTVDLPTFYQIVVSGTGLGLQNVTACTFDGTINREDVYIIGRKTPIDRPVQHPYDVRVTIETLAATVGQDNNFQTKFVEDYDWDGGSGSITVRVDPTGGGNPYCLASGLRPVDGGFSVNVGQNSVSTLTLAGFNMTI